MQSWSWSELKELEGYTAVRLGLFEGETLAGGAIAYLYPSPAEAGLAGMPDGPVLDWSAPEVQVSVGSLVAAVREAPVGRCLVAVRMEPRLPAGHAATSALPRAPVDLVPDETLEVDLGPEAEMLRRLTPKGRYNVRLAARHGVEVVSSTDPADVHELYQILEHTAGYQGFLLEPKSFFINFARTLFPTMGRLAFARYRGMTLAAALTIRHGTTVTYLYGGHVPLFPEVMATYALHWHLLREAAGEGYRVYDFYGYVPPGRSDHPYDGFSRFKDRFGGRQVRRCGSRDVVFYDRLTEAALRIIRRAPVPAGLAGEER